MLQNRDYLSRPEVVRLTGASVFIIQGWVKNGWVPEDHDTRLRRQYPRAYFERLMEFTSGKVPTHGHARLCMLEWRVERDGESSTEILRELRILQIEGKVYAVDDASSTLGYARDTIRRWIVAGVLPAIKIEDDPRSWFFFLRDDILRAKEILGRLTCYEVAEQLGVTRLSVKHMARTGQLKGIVTPDGWRFELSEVKRCKIAYDALVAQKETLWPVSRAREYLGVHRSAMERWRREGLLSCRRIRGRWYYIPAEVMSLKTQRETMNAGFEWIIAPDVSETYGPKRVRGRLNISESAFQDWVREDLLPFYDLSTPSPRTLHCQRYYPAAYIDALVEYAGTPRVSKGTARKYKSIAAQMAGE